MGPGFFQQWSVTGKGAIVKNWNIERFIQTCKKIFYCEGDGALEQDAQRNYGESPSLEMFKSYLDSFLCNLL